ncbi:sigma factor-like helix-turn-helix DNA-binding protein [Kitasatospora sp. NPDC058965]|uniref:sigma factor-like helix-turn-helix DNA-binding protein n=1 Tax=Kitasatospora sp. NPDC058965 TaxID=3346682 RepID=UPI0036BC6EAB
MTGENGEDGRASLRPHHRLSYDVFCTTHERAWRAVARARLHEDALVERAVRGMKADLWREWELALRESVPACYAWMLIKARIADLLLETGLAAQPPRAVLPDWIVALDLEESAALRDYDRLYEAILRLSDRQYDALVLRQLLGLDHRVVADYLGLTEAGARTTAGQGLAKVHRLLGIETGEGR